MSQSVRIGQASRQDLWVEKAQAEMPGPGNYSVERDVFGKQVVGGHIGLK